MTPRERILEKCAFDENYQSPLRGLCTTEADIRIWNDGGICQVHRLLPIIQALLDANEKLVSSLNKINHSIANAQEWYLSDPEDSELDRDSQIGNWLERAFDELKSASQENQKLMEGLGE